MSFQFSFFVSLNDFHLICRSCMRATTFAPGCGSFSSFCFTPFYKRANHCAVLTAHLSPVQVLRLNNRWPLTWLRWWHMSHRADPSPQRSAFMDRDNGRERTMMGNQSRGPGGETTGGEGPGKGFERLSWKMQEERYSTQMWPLFPACIRCLGNTKLPVTARRALCLLKHVFLFELPLPQLVYR